MAAQAWKLYAAAKKKIGAGTLTLGAGIFRMSLHRSSASGTITSLSAISVFSSVGFELTTGAYPAGGKTLPPATGHWTAGRSATEWKFSYSTSGLVFTATGGALNNIRYALIRKSAGAVTSGFPLCYCSLSSAAFTIPSGGTVTILPHANGVFYLV